VDDASALHARETVHEAQQRTIVIERAGRDATNAL
jgi:hypothetical protein